MLRWRCRLDAATTTSTVFLNTKEKVTAAFYFVIYHKLTTTMQAVPNLQRRNGIPPFKAMKDLFNDDAMAEDYLIDNGCLNVPTHCEQCGEPVTCTPNRKRLIRCGRRDCIRNHGTRWQRSIVEGTFFMGCRIPLNDILHFLWLCLCGCRNKFFRSYFTWSASTMLIGVFSSDN